MCRLVGVKAVTNIWRVETRRRWAKRQEFVARYVLPVSLGQDFLRTHPAIEGIGPATVALRQWLRVHIASTEMLAMPSRSVDALWHEFISRAADYETFCVGAYGKQLHHYPETSMSPAESLELSGPAMARTFSIACIDEDIRPNRPSRLPVLFAADSHIGLSEGIRGTSNVADTTAG
jgi:hypothetical protein